jgi:ribosome-interacting GTPase 1
LIPPDRMVTIESMPANLTPEYLEAEEKYKKARTPGEKIKALEDMLSKVPKHKGTEKIQADIKSKLSKLRKQSESKSGPSRRKEMYHISKEGAGRIVLVGAPNAGKSSIFTALTNADSEVREYPFTTRKPVPGMMPFEDISIQLIDLPPISEQFMETWVPQVIRLTDAALLVVNISALDPLKQIDEPLKLLAGRKIRLEPWKEEIGEEAREERGDSSIASIRTLAAASFIDVEGAREMLELVEGEARGGLELIPVSPVTGDGIDELRRRMFLCLGIERVYSKQPGRKPSPDPFVLKKGSTVADFASKVHKDFVEKFDFARIWRRGADEMDGIRVSRDFVLGDGDTVELHM